MSAGSRRSDREKAGAGRQHRRLGHVDLATNFHPLQYHLLDLLQVDSLSVGPL